MSPKVKEVLYMAGHYRDIASITRGVAILLIILALIAIGFGIYKVAVYEYSDWAPVGGTNCYVSGYDRYTSNGFNLVINGTYFVGWVTLGGVLFLSGMILMATSIYCSGKAKEALSRSQD